MLSQSCIAATIFILTACIFPTTASQGQAGHGFIGYGITMYKPACASACQGFFSNYALKCEGPNGYSNMYMDGMWMEMPTTECYATNDPFLQSVAYCISTHCQDITEWKLERWWNTRVPGRMPNQPTPKETYQQTLARITTPPTAVTPSNETLNLTSLVDEESYTADFNADYIFEINEATHERYGLVLLTTGAAIPIAMSLLRFIPFPQTLVSRFNAIFIDAPAFGSYHRVPVLNAFLAPTRGQALFIAYLWIINVVLCSVGYQSRQPNAWYATRYEEVATYVSYRTGVLSFANLPLLILYAGRNNVLLWVTNWSHSTFVLLHRWIAFICTLQACIHSAVLLNQYMTIPSNDYPTEHKLPYWIWGIVATLGLVILLPTSILPLRRKAYELFLAWHVLISFIAVLMGAYYHVVLEFGHQWGYETWIYIAFAVWGFDRVMRILRVARNGVRTGRVTVIDEDYVRLDILGVSASGQAYIYFPTLTWRVWENHPFSVAGALVTKHTASTGSSPEEISSPASISKDSEKLASHDIQRISSHQQPPPTKPYALGLTFFIRTQTGLTSLLRSRTTLPLLIESSYGTNVYGDHGGVSLSSYPNLICIAGGVGITAILPFLSAHVGQKKLFWGVRSGKLVEAVEDVMGFEGVEVMVKEGERLNLRGFLEREIAADQGVGTVVVVSGPPGMADDVRVLVSELVMRHKNANVAFVEESYSW